MLIAELVLSLTFAGLLLGLARWSLSTGPYKLPRLLPWRLVGRARVTWRERPFFGWGRDWFGLARFALGTNEDSVGIVGPPRVGKTAGILIPQALIWRGPL